MTTVADSQKSKWSTKEAGDWIQSEVVAYRKWYYWQVRGYRLIQIVVVIGTGVSTFAATVTAAAVDTRWIPTACAAFATLLTGLSSGLGLNNIVSLRETGRYRVTMIEQRAKIELTRPMTEEERAQLQLHYLDEIAVIERDYGRPTTIAESKPTRSHG